MKLKTINSIKSSKCVGPNSIPTKILHLIKDKISIPLSELVNKSPLQLVAFPKYAKLQKLFRFLKLNQDFFVITIGLFFSC